MKNNNEILNILFIFLKCFIVVFIFGFVLPLFFEAILRNLISQNNIYENSILVFNNTSKSFQFLYNYIMACRIFFAI